MIDGESALHYKALIETVQSYGGIFLSELLKEFDNNPSKTHPYIEHLVDIGVIKKDLRPDPMRGNALSAYYSIAVEQKPRGGGGRMD